MLCLPLLCLFNLHLQQLYPLLENGLFVFVALQLLPQLVIGRGLCLLQAVSHGYGHRGGVVGERFLL